MEFGKEVNHVTIWKTDILKERELKTTEIKTEVGFCV